MSEHCIGGCKSDYTTSNCGHRNGDMYEALICPHCQFAATKPNRLLLEAAESLMPFMDAIDANPAGWAFGKDDDSAIYELQGKGHNASITVGHLRALRSAINAAKGNQ